MKLMAVVAVFVITLSLSAACSGSLNGESPTTTYAPVVKTRLAGASRRERTPQPTTTPRRQPSPRVLTPVPTAPPEPTKTLFPTATPNPLAGKFAQVLLTVDAMPTGWSAKPRQLDIELTPNNYVCGATIEDLAVVNIQADFQKSVNGPYSAQGLSLFQTPEQAGLTLQDTETGIRSCPPEGFSEEGVTITIASLSFPRVGDQSFAYRLTVATERLTLEEDVVISRVGKVLTTISYGGFIGSIERIDSTRTEQLARAAEEKIRSMTEFINSLEIPMRSV